MIFVLNLTELEELTANPRLTKLYTDPSEELALNHE